MDPVSFFVEFGEIRSEISASPHESLHDVASVQSRVIDCIRSHEIEPPEVFDILVNTKDNRDHFIPLTSDSFSDLSWWHGTVIRVQTGEQPNEATEEAKEASAPTSGTVRFFDDDLKLDEVLFALDRAHLSKPIQEVCEILDISETQCETLNTVLEETTITDADMDLWAGYGGSGKIFYNGVESVKANLSQLISYASHPPAQHGLFVTEKMKTIAHVLSRPGAQDQYDVAQVLLYLASHGMACNVLKEVAISMTYSLLTGSTEEFVRQQSLENTVLRALRECRYNVVEELYSSYDGTENNIHGIATLNNYLADNMEGIPKIEDPDISNWGLPTGWEDEAVDKFFAIYTLERCLKTIKSCVREKKIGYQQIVEWFEARAPPGDKYAFLARVFDADNGEINVLYLSWMLAQMNVFTLDDGSDENGDIEMAG